MHAVHHPLIYGLRGPLLVVLTTVILIAALIKAARS